MVLCLQPGDEGQYKRRHRTCGRSEKTLENAGKVSALVLSAREIAAQKVRRSSVAHCERAGEMLCSGLTWPWRVHR